MRQSFFHSLIDNSVQPEELEPENPNSVEEVVKSYLKYAKELIQIVEDELEICAPNFFKIENLHQFIGYRVSAGARKVKK